MATHDDDAQVGDIEIHISHYPGINYHESPSPPPPTSSSTPATTTQTNPTTSIVVYDHQNYGKIEHGETINNKPTPTTPSTTQIIACVWYFFLYAIVSVSYYLICILLPVLGVPLLEAYLLCSLCLTGDFYTLLPKKWYTDDESNLQNGQQQSAKSTRRRQGVYKKLQDFKTTKEQFTMWNMIIMIRLGFLALLCLVISHRVKISDPWLWRWWLLVVIVFLGYPIILLYINLQHVLVLSDLYSNKVAYFIEGLVESFAWVLHVAVTLLMWLFYFRVQHDLNLSERVARIGVCTIVSLLVGAVLWVLKSATLLEWKANAVYRRFKCRILTVGFHLYCLSIITEGSCGLLHLEEAHYWRGRKKQEDEQLSSAKELRPSTSFFTRDEAKDTKNPRNIQDIVSSYESDDLDLLDKVAMWITKLARVTPRARKDGGIPDIIASYREKIASRRDGGTVITKQDLMTEFGFTNEEDAQLLLQELKGGQMSEEINYDTLQKWTVDTHQNCLSFGYTLIDAFKVVSVLNRVVIGSVVVTVILVWLLITRLATTKVLLLIASPFFATTFVFSDTIKTFFQGIIFSFVIHPYNVGDRCIIEGMELEVTLIGILTTTFARIGTKEKMMYPNSSLATKFITNLEGEPDPSDMIDLILNSSTTKLKILGLKKDIERFFESDDRHGSYEKTNHVAFKEMGSSIKVSISFTHVMNIQDVSHSQCLQKKNKQRSELLIHIKQFLEDWEIQLAAS